MAFTKGHAKIGGRKKGTPNKTTILIKEAIMDAFGEAGGAEYLKRVAEEDPRIFCSLLSKLLPAELNTAADQPECSQFIMQLGNEESK